MKAHDLVNVGESALVLYSDGELDIEDGSGLSAALTVNIHVSVDKVIVYQQDVEEEDEGLVYVADFAGFEETDGDDGFRVRFTEAERVGEADAGWFSFSGRSDTTPFHIQPSP